MPLVRTPEQIKEIATILNKDLNFPVATEEVEQGFIEWVLTATLPLLTDEVVNFITDASNGLTTAEINKWEDIVTAKVLDATKIKWIPKFVLEPIVRPVIRRLLSYCQEGMSIPQV